MYSLGVSLTITASHSAVVPAGDLATQCDSVGEVSLTEMRCRAKNGRFSKRRQNRYKSSAPRLIVTHLMTRRARFFSIAIPLLRAGVTRAPGSCFTAVPIRSAKLSCGVEGRYWVLPAKRRICDVVGSPRQIGTNPRIGNRSRARCAGVWRPSFERSRRMCVSAVRLPFSPSYPQTSCRS